jgi:hypothetical protein
VVQDYVYTVDSRAVEGRVAPVVDKVMPPKENMVAPVTQVAWCVVAGVALLVITTKSGFGVWNSDTTEMLFYYALSADVSADEGAEVPHAPFGCHVERIFPLHLLQLLLTSCAASPRFRPPTTSALGRRGGASL